MDGLEPRSDNWENYHDRYDHWNDSSLPSSTAYFPSFNPSLAYGHFRCPSIPSDGQTVEWTVLATAGCVEDSVSLKLIQSF